MTLTVRQATFTKTVRQPKKAFHNQSEIKSPLSGEPVHNSVQRTAPGHGGAGYQAPDNYQVQPLADLVAIGIQKLGADIDPFYTLPVESHFTLPKLINHCKLQTFGRLFLII